MIPHYPPHIQAPNDTQSYNRYSYVKNNPLKYTDPSGYFFSGLKKWFSKHRKAIITAIASAIAIATGQYYALNFILKGALVGFVGGATSTLVNGGSIGSAFKNGFIGALFGAVTAGFANGIGDIGNFGLRALAHGASSSFMTRARGGRWSSGFWSGFVGTVLSPVAGAAKGFYGKLAANAVVAGTISQVTGGKFANGAWSGAFRFMFNEVMHTAKKAYAFLWKPVGYGSSSFGHISIGIGNTSYSWGPGGMNVRNLGEYINKQTQFRDGVGVELDLTQDQIGKLESYLSSYNINNSYFPIGNNCGEPIETTLQNFGYNIGNYVFPTPLFLDIHNSGAIKNSFNILKDKNVVLSKVISYEN